MRRDKQVAQLQVAVNFLAMPRAQDTQQRPSKTPSTETRETIAETLRHLPFASAYACMTRVKKAG